MYDTSIFIEHWRFRGKDNAHRTLNVTKVNKRILGIDNLETVCDNNNKFRETKTDNNMKTEG